MRTGKSAADVGHQVAAHERCRKGVQREAGRLDGAGCEHHHRAGGDAEELAPARDVDFHGVHPSAARVQCNDVRPGHEKQPSGGVGVVRLPDVAADRVDQQRNAGELVVAEQPGHRRAALHRQRRGLNAGEAGHGRRRRGHRGEQRRLEVAEDEVRIGDDAGLALDGGVVRVQPSRDGGRPAGQVGVGEPRAPAAPVDRLAAGAVRQTGELDVAPPRQPPHELARGAGIGARHDRRGDIEADIAKVLHVLGDEQARRRRGPARAHLGSTDGSRWRSTRRKPPHRSTIAENGPLARRLLVGTGDETAQCVGGEGGVLYGDLDGC